MKFDTAENHAADKIGEVLLRVSQRRRWSREKMFDGSAQSGIGKKSAG